MLIVNEEDIKIVVSYINQCPSPPSVVWQAMKRLHEELEAIDYDEEEENHSGLWDQE